MKSRKREVNYKHWKRGAWSRWGISFCADSLRKRESGSFLIMLFLILSVVIVLSVSFLCSMAEAVLLSINVNSLASGRNRTSPAVIAAWKRMKSNIGRPIAAILILNTVANTGGSVVASAAFIKVFGEKWLWTFSLGMTVAILFGTEILPKIIGVGYCRFIAPLLTAPLEYATKILHPVILLTEWFTKPFKAKSEGSQVTSADILTLASMARAGKAIGMEQENIIVNAIRLSHSPATTAMIPREKIRYIINGISLEENEKRLGGVLTNTRYPLCSEDSIDSIIGTINHKKFALAHGEKSSDFTSMARELILINPDVTLLQALQTMIRAKSHMIFVKGGDGKIAGLLTLEDITDELVDVALPD